MNDNSHAVRLYNSLLEHMGKEAADEITRKYPLSKSASFRKKFDWAENICGDLERTVDETILEEIRMGCACGPAPSKAKALRKLFLTCTGPEQFAERASGKNEGFTIAYEDGGLVLIYPTCYCSCVKRVDKPLPRTWCMCTLGYTKRMFECVLDRPVTVKLLESIKTGGRECKIWVTWMP